MSFNQKFSPTAQAQDVFSFVNGFTGEYGPAFEEQFESKFGFRFEFAFAQGRDGGFTG